MIILFTQAYLTHGGMQTYMRRIAEIATAYCHEREEPLDCISLTDVGQDPSMHQTQVNYQRMIGCGGSKLGFLRQAMLRTSSGSGLCVVGHLALASTALAMKRLGIISDYLVVLHGIEAWRRKGWLTRTAVRQASGIIATTRFTAKEFQVQNGFVVANVFIMPLALEDALVADPAPVPGRPELRVLSVGRLDKSERYKGFDEVILATAQLRRENIPVTLRIVGAGDDAERLAELAREAGAIPYVHFAGGIPDDALRREYQTCDVFALPSAKEGFGIVFLEAMSYGKPCVGGRHGGTPEVIRDGVDGYLVEFGNVEQLAQKLKHLYEHPDQAVAMGESSLARLRSEFTFSVMRRRWFAAFDSILRGSRNPCAASPVI